MSTTLAHLELDASSKVSQTCKIIRHIQGPDIARTTYSSIFKELGDIQDIKEYSSGSGGGSEGVPCSFSKIERSVLISEERL